MTRFKNYALLGVIVLGIGAAHAQQRTMAIYGDWTLSCTMASDRKSCGLIQSQKVQGQTSPVSEIGVGRRSDGRFRLFIEISADAWIPGGVKLIADASAITTAFEWCIAPRCLADVDLTDNEIRNLRAQRKAGRIVYKNGSQADVSIPLSFNGFSDALEALQGEGAQAMPPG
jgi:invasion protein IalB